MDHAMGPLGDAVVVSDQDNRFALGIEAIDQIENLKASLGIQISSGFIGEDHDRIVDQAPRDGHSLLLPPESCIGR